ncbi:MAG TPA: ABC transporter substrate-binding protein [Solirubrobacteraceae bacterium]|nr:ABC transporter substrate-binding protein [Solirubrobacteraceae bacterium]
MRRASLTWLMSSLLVVIALVAAGCGGEDDGTSGSKSNNPNPSGAEIGEGKQGGAVTFLAAGDVDYLDPGQTYYTFGYMVQYAVNRPLYSFEPDDAENPVPDVADGEPEISEDNTEITVKIKSGIKFSPPVNREVTSKDIKYGIERAFTTNVPSGYATSYFAEIEGAPAEPVKMSELEPFSGLQTPDDQTLVIKLTKPVAPRVAAALVMPITVPVPQEYAEKYDKENPSTYDQYVAFTGPYMVKNDPSTGKVTGRDPGKKIELVRNPSWSKDTDYRPAFLDSITIEEGNDDLTVASRRTLSGQKLMCCDSGQPPISILKRALTRFKDQLGRVPGGGTRWIALNTKVKPFDNLNVRKALIAGFDRNALRLTRGGEEVGPIAQSFIPPGIPGHEESGGEQGFTEFDWMQKPTGDPALARKYMEAAAEEGVPVKNGKYAGADRILTVATNADPGKTTSTVAQTEFNKLGFKLNFRQVPQDTLYTKFCGVPERKVAICPNVGWFKDFQDPESMLQPTFSGEAIKPAGNVNWSQLDVPEINDAMKEAALLPQGDERNQAWAEINKQIVAQAPGIPYVWDDSFQLASRDLNAVMNGYYTTWDLSFSSVK